MLQEILDAIRGQWHPTLVKVIAEKEALCAGDYHAEDVVSEATSGATSWHFKDVAKRKGGGGYIVGALVTAETTAIASWLSLYLFTRSPTCELNDDVQNTAPILADRHIYLGRIDFPTCGGLGTNEMSESEASPSTVGNLPKMFVCEWGSKDLWGVVVIRNVVDLADTTFLTVSLFIEQF